MTCAIHLQWSKIPTFLPNILEPARLLCLWGFSRQEYWSGWLCPPPGNLPNPGIKPSLLHCRQILHCLSHQGSPVHKCRMFKREKKEQCNIGAHVKPYLNTQHSFTQQKFNEQLLCQALSKASSAKLVGRAIINSWKQLRITCTHTKQNTNEIQCSKALAIFIQLTVAKSK